MVHFQVLIYYRVKIVTLIILAEAEYQLPGYIFGVSSIVESLSKSLFLPVLHSIS